MAQISVVISAFNEEKKIKACLESVGWADEIIVVDNSSTDKTAEIAKRFTKEVFHQKNDPSNVDLQKNFGIEKATKDWILILDADELVTKELAEEIKTVIKDDHQLVNGFWIPRKNIIFGKWIEHTGWYPDPQLRLFKEGKGKFVKRHFHEPIQIEGQTGELKGNLVHHNYETVTQFLRRGLEIYAPNEAEEMIKKGYEFNYRDVIKLPFQEFLSRYFAREGYKDGFHGLVLSLLMAFYHFAIFLYIWEKKNFVELGNEEIKYGVREELKNTKNEMNYWMDKQLLQEEKNPVKNKLLKMRRKIGF